MGLDGVWGEEASSEDAAHSLEDLSLKMPWQGNKARALILKLHNDWVLVIHRVWSHLCLQRRGLWSSCSRLHSIVRAEYNIKHCWRSVWNLSSFINTTMHNMRRRMYLDLWFASEMLPTLRWVEITKLRCVCVCAYHTCLFIVVFAHAAAFGVVSLCRAFISFWNVQGEKAASARNRCYLWVLCQRSQLQVLGKNIPRDKYKYKKLAWHIISCGEWETWSGKNVRFWVCEWAVCWQCAVMERNQKYGVKWGKTLRAQCRNISWKVERPHWLKINSAARRLP